MHGIFQAFFSSKALDHEKLQGTREPVQFCKDYNRCKHMLLINQSFLLQHLHPTPQQDPLHLNPNTRRSDPYPFNPFSPKLSTYKQVTNSKSATTLWSTGLVAKVRALIHRKTMKHPLSLTEGESTLLSL